MTNDFEGCVLLQPGQLAIQYTTDQLVTATEVAQAWGYSCPHIPAGCDTGTRPMSDQELFPLVAHLV